VQRRLSSKSLVQIPKACLGDADLAASGVPIGETGVAVIGQRVIIVNQPGRLRSTGTKDALEGPPEGHTWTFLNVTNLSTLSGNA
jgi:hypothetical protein